MIDNETLFLVLDTETTNSIDDPFAYDVGFAVVKAERTKRDMAQMVALCVQNGYDLSVKFKEFGLYRINHDIKVYQTIMPSLIQDFINQQEILDFTKKGQFALINSLDSIRKQITEYNDETPTIKKSS